MKISLSNLLTLLKLKNHGQHGKSKEVAELSINFIFCLRLAFSMEETDIKLDGKSRPFDLDKTLWIWTSETKMSNLTLPVPSFWSPDIASISIGQSWAPSSTLSTWECANHPYFLERGNEFWNVNQNSEAFQTVLWGDKCSIVMPRPCRCTKDLFIQVSSWSGQENLDLWVT